MIINYEDEYITLDDGRIRSLFKIGGYYCFKLDGIRYQLHRYIAEKRIPNPDNLPQVNHKDLDKTNNELSNLEWVSQKDNLHHAMKNGVHNWGIMPIIAHKIGTAFGMVFPSQASANRYGFQQSNIAKVIKGERTHHKGFMWNKLEVNYVS